MGKRKIMWNPVNPETTPKQYESRVGNIVHSHVNTPGSVESLFKHLMEDTERLRSLADVHLHRRTGDKPKWKGASGYEHQIDESFSTEDEKVILLVECKHWTKSVDFPAFSAFLVRVIDIATEKPDSTVLGMMATTQGYKGKAGGTDNDQDCIAKLQSQFGKMGYCVSLQWLPD